MGEGADKEQIHGSVICIDAHDPIIRVGVFDDIEGTIANCYYRSIKDGGGAFDGSSAFLVQID